MNREPIPIHAGLVLAFVGLLTAHTALAQSSPRQATRPLMQLLQAANSTAPAAPSQATSRSKSASKIAPPAAFGTALSTASSQRAPLSTALIILTQDATEQSLAPLTEDLNVMCRIFDRALGQAGLRSNDVFSHMFIATTGREWIPRLFADHSSWTECLYVDGYGPLFLVTVDFPLVAPPQEPAPTDPNQPRDPIWESVARELHAPPGADRHPNTDHGPTYNPEKALTLRTTLIKALKHAVNIRALTDNNTVTVMVRSEQTYGPPFEWLVDSTGAAVSETLPLVGGEFSQPSRRASTLVIRANLGEIQAFAAGDVSFADFEKGIEANQY